MPEPLYQPESTKQEDIIFVGWLGTIIYTTFLLKGRGLAQSLLNPSLNGAPFHLLGSGAIIIWLNARRLRNPIDLSRLKLETSTISKPKIEFAKS